MKIGLFGYGKMGREIEAIARERGHEIALRIDLDNRNTISDDDLRKADVMIEFTSPEAVLENIKQCFQAKVPVVVGSTGWHQHLDSISRQCLESGTAMIYASNFSLGVNIFFALNKYLARIMNAYPEYEPSMVEIHHTQKLDSPSGTAITLANGIIDALDRKSSWINSDAPAREELKILSERKDNVPGTHQVKYESAVDTIDICHTAHNRKGFALGAVMAAEWLHGKTGFYSIEDMLKFD